MADPTTILRDTVADAAEAIDPGPAIGPVLARSRRFRRRRRVVVGGAALAVVLGGAGLVAATTAGTTGERTSTYVTDPGTTVPGPASYRIFVTADEVAFPEVGLTLEPMSQELGPLDPELFTSTELLMRADRPVEVDWVRVTDRAGVGAMVCTDLGNQERVCDEPDRSPNQDGWSLVAGGELNITVFMDQTILGPGRFGLEATVATGAGTIAVPFRVEVVPSREVPPPPPRALHPVGGGPGRIRLRPVDWRETVESEGSNDFTGAPFTVVDAGGSEVGRGNAGVYGEISLPLPPGTYTVRVDTLVTGTPCGFARTVEAAASEVTDVELRCP